MSVDLSVIIVNWNTRELLSHCLESVAGSQGLVLGSDQESLAEGSKYPNFEVFVIDNASTDGSAAKVREYFPWVQLIENNGNVGFASANNQGIRQSNACPEQNQCSRYALLLNSDTIVHAGALQEMVKFMDVHPHAGAVGARLLNADNSLQHACHPMLSPEREFWRLAFLDRLISKATYPMERWSDITPRQIETIKGACLLVRQDALDQVGLLDEDYFMYTEEVDLCYRLVQAGWQLWYVPRSVVTHFGGASSRQMAEDMYLELYRSKTQFFRKFGGERRANRFKTYLRLTYWPRAIVARLVSIVNPTWKSRAHTYNRLLDELKMI